MRERRGLAWFDRFLGAARDLFRRIGGTDDEDSASRRVSFTIAVIALSAKMAKADGTVTDDEIAAFREIFTVPAHEYKNVARVYDLARQDTAGYEVYARQVVRLFGERHIVLEDLLDALFHIARADGHVHPDEMTFIRRVSEIFGFEEACFERIAARHVGPERGSPWALLGIAPDADEAAIRTAWRELVKQHHPDRLVALGMPREFVALANERLAAINAAHERIMAQRRALAGDRTS